MKRCCRDVQSIYVIDCRPYGERLKNMLMATVLIVRPIVVSRSRRYRAGWLAGVLSQLLAIYNALSESLLS